MNRLVMGCNESNLVSMQSAVPGVHAYRCYYDTHNFVPLTWGGHTNRPHTDFGIMSLRPEPDLFLRDREIPDNGSGQTTLAGQIAHLISTAPNHAELSVWHEAGPGNPLGYPAYITAASMTAMHAKMLNLCRTTPNMHGGRVQYGSIIVGPANRRVDWLGHRLDWYGVDIYDAGSVFQDVAGHPEPSLFDFRMDNNLHAWTSVANGTPSIRVCETNSPHDANRPAWFRMVNAWMAANHGYRVLHFWRDGGALSGAWPPSKATLASMNTLQKEFGR